MADLRQRVRIEATLQDKGASRGLDNIRGKSESALGERQGLAFHAGKAKLAMAALGAAVGAAAFGVARMVTEVARQNDEIAKMSTRLGASTEALSQLRFVAERSGVEFNTLTMGLQRMTRRIAEAAQGSGEAKDALRELGLSARALNQLRPEDQFEAIADAMQGVATNGDRVRLAMRLFDSEGVSLVQTMAAGAQGIRELRGEADRMGLTLSGEAARSAEEFQDKITNLTGAVDGLKKSFAEGVIVELNTFEATLSSPEMDRAARDFGNLLGNIATKAAAAAGELARYRQQRNAEIRDILFEETGTTQGALFQTGTSVGLDRFGFTPGSGISIQGQGEASLNGVELRGKSLSSRVPTQSRLDPAVQASIERGKRSATAYLTSYRTEFAKNVDQDIEIPMATAGDRAALAFLDNLKPALTAGFADFILEGDIKQATKLFGATLAAGMAYDAARVLVEGSDGNGGIIGGLRDLGTGFKAESIIDAGQGIGNKLLDGFDNVNFAGRFSSEGDIGGAIGKSLSGAIVGAITGAQIGSLFGKNGAIGGAIGGGLGDAVAQALSASGPLGLAIGGIASVLGSSIFSSFAASDFASRKYSGITGEAVDAFKLGGIQNLQGSDALAAQQQRFNNAGPGAGRSAAIQQLADEIRKELPEMKPGEALDMAQALLANDYTGARAAVINAAIRGALKQQFEKEKKKAETLQGIAAGAGVYDGSTIISTPDDTGRTYDDFFADADSAAPHPAGKPVGTAGPGVQGTQLSISGLLAAKSRGLLTLELDKIPNGRVGTPIGNNIINLVNAGGNDPSSEAYLRGLGFDIVAARGYHGMVQGPTAILAGEAGPERVDITPGGSDYVGGGRGGGSVANHFSITINAMDASSVDAAAERLVERVRQGLLEASERGLPVTYGSGVVSPPRV